MRTIAVSIVVLFATPAFAGPIAAAQKSVGEAIAAVRAAGGECKETALSALKDARDQLDAAKRSGSRIGLSKARRAIEDALDDYDLTDDEKAAVLHIVEKSLAKAIKKATKSHNKVTAACCGPDEDLAHKIADQVERNKKALIANLMALR